MEHLFLKWDFNRYIYAFCSQKYESMTILTDQGDDLYLNNNILDNKVRGSSKDWTNFSVFPQSISYYRIII